MKKIVLLLLILLSASAAFAAKPFRSGVYVNAKVGAMRVDMKRDGERKDDVVFPFAFALGLRIRHFRIEAEYNFATTAKRDNYEQQTDYVSGQVYYDIPFKTPIRPFVNFGMGRHSTQVKEKNVFKDTRRGWAWNLGGGVTWAVSNAVNIDLGYRYLNIGDLKTKVGTVKTKHHFAYIGWRYVF